MSFAVAFCSRQTISCKNLVEMFSKSARRFPDLVTPANYLSITITWTIARSIYCIVTEIVGPIASVNVPFSTGQPITQQLIQAIAIAIIE